LPKAPPLDRGRNTLKFKYIYFDVDNLRLFIDWLRQQPRGHYRLLLGSESIRERSVILELVSLEDPELGRWLVDKVRVHEIRMILINKEADFPQRIEFEPIEA
jgi:hypothetical protein